MTKPAGATGRSDDGRDGGETLAVLATLHQTEVSANVGELQAATATVLGLLAYLAATIVFLDDINVYLVALLPLGVVFGASYQMLRAAVVARRAKVARVYERHIACACGFGDAFDEGRLGSPFYNALDDVNVIRSEKRQGWVVGLAVAGFAYFGLYFASIAYTVAVVWTFWQDIEPRWVGICVATFYLVLWGCILAAVPHLFKDVAPHELEGLGRAHEA